MFLPSPGQLAQWQHSPGLSASHWFQSCVWGLHSPDRPCGQQASLMPSLMGYVSQGDGLCLGAGWNTFGEPSSAFQCIWFLVASQLQFWMSQKFFLICIILLEACYQSDELHFYLPSMNSLKRALILSLLIAKEIQGAKSLWPLASAELWWSCWLGCILQHIHWVCSLLLGLGTCMALCELDWVQHKPVLQLQVASVNREHLQLSSLRIVWIQQKLYFMKSSTF